MFNQGEIFTDKWDLRKQDWGGGCKRVVTVWDMEYRLGKEECMAMMEVRHRKSGRVKALETCEVREYLEWVLHGRAGKSQTGMPEELSDACHYG